MIEKKSWIYGQSVGISRTRRKTTTNIITFGQTKQRSIQHTNPPTVDMGWFGRPNFSIRKIGLAFCHIFEKSIQTVLQHKKISANFDPASKGVFRGPTTSSQLEAENKNSLYVLNNRQQPQCQCFREAWYIIEFRKTTVQGNARQCSDSASRQVPDISAQYYNTTGTTSWQLLLVFLTTISWGPQVTDFSTYFK